MPNPLTIGLISGIHGIVATYVKSALLAAIHQAGLNARIIECDLELPANPPSDRHAWADRKLTALESALRLEEQGADVIVIGDWRSEPFIEELRKELRTPVLSFLEEAAREVARRGIKRLGVVGNVIPADRLAPHFPGVTLVEADPSTPCVNTDDINVIRSFADKLPQDVEAILPNCGRIAGVVKQLEAYQYPFLDIFAIGVQSLIEHVPAPYPRPFKVGMIGGLGPAATVDLYDKITRATPAKNDQEHIRVVIEQNPQIADRTAHLLNHEEDPTCAMYDAARRLEKDGCDAIVIPCNTAHAFLPFLERHIKVPFINMQQVTMEEIFAQLGHDARIGLLATTGTVRTGLYGDKARAMGMALFTPDDEHQALVMNAIYGPKGVKAGFTDGECREDLLKAATFLVREYDCNCLILGCTELPLILEETPAFAIEGKTVRITDPTAALARKVVNLALTTNKERGWVNKKLS